ncbi:MAG: hypothetical protein KME20_10590 [Kaiparowitsia implicata GSE-PSE-MK54-09C]|jgi:hypothetical protein|nr:hypothetical protein [Kaiparowitsia implicata GSE-PSE-MK54-09C]
MCAKHDKREGFGPFGILIDGWQDFAAGQRAVQGALVSMVVVMSTLKRAFLW